MKWNYSLLEPGEYTLTIIVTDLLGSKAIQDRIFTTIAFNSAFIADPDQVQIQDAVITTPKSTGLSFPVPKSTVR